MGSASKDGEGYASVRLRARTLCGIPGGFL